MVLLKLSPVMGCLVKYLLLLFLLLQITVRPSNYLVLIHYSLTYIYFIFLIFHEIYIMAILI
jgi:hypothetical protein